MPKVLSLNVTDGGRRLRPLVERALGKAAPDLVTLQEVRADTVGDWRRSLELAGFHVADTFELARRHDLPRPGPFRNDGLLIASRWPIQPIDPTRSKLMNCDSSSQSVQATASSSATATSGSIATRTASAVRRSSAFW